MTVTFLNNSKYIIIGRLKNIPSKDGIIKSAQTWSIDKKHVFIQSKITLNNVILVRKIVN